MPLLPLPASNTKRYFVGVFTPYGEHHTQIRCADTVSDGQAVIDIGFTFGLLLPLLYLDCAFHELLVAEHGSDIRNPVTGWTNLQGTTAFGMPAEEAPRSLCFRGRSSTGRKVRAFLYGLQFVRDADWVNQPPAGSDIEAFVDIMRTSPTYFLAIDGTKPVWRQDATVNYNDHWVEEARP